jgi:hypothetical protein
MKSRLIILIILTCLILSCDGFSSDGEITVYPVMCRGELKNGVCKGLLIHLGRDVYKVSSNNQTVIYWSPGVAEEPRKLANCIVRDKKNWVGEYKDGSAKLQMVKGDLSETVSADNTKTIKEYYEKVFYVSKWRWWYANITGCKDLRGLFSN